MEDAAPTVGHRAGAPGRPAEGTDGVRTPHRGVAVLCAVVAVSAWAGAAGLVMGFLSITPRLEARLPFASPVLGGLALAAIVALPMTVTAVLAARGDPRTGDAALLTGLLQVGWIVVQLLFIRELSFFHPTFLLVGAALAWIGEGIRRRGKMAP